LEDVTGKDLNWFWNQWYYGSGQPDLNINYNYSDGKARVIVEQQQKSGKTFQLPIAIDVYNNGANKKRYNVWLQNPADTFYFASAQKPSFINVDADKVLLATKKDHKTAEEFEQQLKYAPNFLDRREALDYFAKNKLSTLANGLSDTYSGIRLFTLEKLEEAKSYTIPSVLTSIEKIAEKDANKKVQAKALEILAQLNDKKYQPLFAKYVNDSSYSVSGAALEGLAGIDPANAYTLAVKYSKDAKGDLGDIVAEIMYANATEADFETLFTLYKNASLSQAKIQGSIALANYLATLKDAAKVKKGVDEIMKTRNMIPEQYRTYIDPAFKQAFGKISAAQKTAGNNEVADYIDGLLK
jgi:aminopeptidase N